MPSVHVHLVIQVSWKILELAAVSESFLGLHRSLALGVFAVDVVQAFGFDLSVDEGTGETSEDLFGFAVAVWFACRERVRCVDGGCGDDRDWGKTGDQLTITINVVLVRFSRLEGSSCRKKLVTQMGSVLALSVVVLAGGLSHIGVCRKSH